VVPGEPTTGGGAPADLKAAIRATKRDLRARIGDVASVFAEVEAAMRAEAAEILATRERGAEVIPVVNFADIAADTVPEEIRAAIHRRGCAVVRQTFPQELAQRWNTELGDYLEHNRFTENYRGPADSFFGTLSSSRPQIYPVYWSKPQVQARQHERMAATRGFLNSLWRNESNGTTWFDPTRDTAYADRIRRREPGDSSFGLSPHIDSGSVERWLLPAYQAVFRHVLDGNWRDYDPWDAAHRTEVQEYPSTQMCGVFRTFQGWTALSEMQPTDGVLHVVPIATAAVHLLLRPLLDDVPEDELCGAELGRALPITERWHPALLPALTPIPPMLPGDTMWWHADLIHSVGDVAGMRRWGNVMYIAAAPHCAKNAAYARRQQAAFLRGGSPPDFAAEDYESDYVDRANVVDLTDIGRQQLGLSPERMTPNR
jgi:hypothetical protein